MLWHFSWDVALNFLVAIKTHSLIICVQGSCIVVAQKHEFSDFVKFSPAFPCPTFLDGLDGLDLLLSPIERDQ